MRRVRVCLTGNCFAGGDEDCWQETVATCALKRNDGRNSQAPQFGEKAEEDPKQCVCSTHKYQHLRQNKRSSPWSPGCPLASSLGKTAAALHGWAMLSHRWSWETGFLAHERADCQPCLLKDLAPDLAVRVPNDGRVQVNKEEKVTRQVKSDKIQKVLS